MHTHLYTAWPASLADRRAGYSLTTQIANPRQALPPYMGNVPLRNVFYYAHKAAFAPYRHGLSLAMWLALSLITGQRSADAARLLRICAAG